MGQLRGPQLVKAPRPLKNEPSTIQRFELQRHNVKRAEQLAGGKLEHGLAAYLRGLDEKNRLLGGLDIR